MLTNLSSDYNTPVVIGVGLTTLFEFVVASFDFSGIHGGMGISAPNNVNFRVDFKTGLSGRAYRGWNSVCGLPTQVLDRNNIDITWADNVKRAYEQLPLIALAHQFDWVVVSRFDAGLPRVAGIVTPITTVSYKDLIIDSYRRRIPGRHF